MYAQVRYIDPLRSAYYITSFKKLIIKRNAEKLVINMTRIHYVIANIGDKWDKGC